MNIFSKFAVVVPIKSKLQDDVLAGIMEGINKMGKKPELIYSDDEGSLNSNVINEYIESQKIEIHRTRTRPAFAERFIRTFKTCCSKESKPMRKRVKRIFNGQIIYLR